MAVIKKFKVDIVSSPTDTTSFFDLGYSFFYIVKFLQARTRLAYDPMGAGTTPWNGAVDVPGYVGATGTVSGITSASASAGIAQIPYYTAGAPKTTVKSLDNPSFVGKYIRLEDIESGYYMVSDGTIQADGSLTNQNYNCYNDSGTRMVQWEQSFGPTPLFTQNNNRRFTLACEFLEDGETIKKRGDGAAINVCSMQYWAEMTMYYYTETITASASQANWDAYIDWLNGVANADESNPYAGAGTSEEDGGDPNEQNFDDDSDTVTEDSMPSLSAVGTGMATIFKPDLFQLRDLASVFWGSQWWTALQNSIEGIDKMFVSLGIVPFTVTAGSTVEVTWLGLAVTEVMLTLAAQQYYEFDMGSIDLSNDSRIYTSDTALDYSPFSKLGIFLPFIGYQEIDIDECRGATIQLIYRIDILSGACVALIKVAGNTIYQFAGNCMTQIPITSQSFENLMTNVTNVGIAWAGARNAGAIAGGGDAGDKVSPGGLHMPRLTLEDPARVQSESKLGSATANAIMGLKPSFNKTGAISSAASLLTVRQPYLFLTTPRMCVPKHLQRYGGFPANITDTLGNFEGFTMVDGIRLNDLVATTPEVDEIYELLHSGVII